MNFSDNQTVAGEAAISSHLITKRRNGHGSYVWPSTFFIAFVGVAGKVIVCLVITFQPQMHTIINYFVRNFAIADLGILLISFPFGIVKEKDPYH